MCVSLRHLHDVCVEKDCRCLGDGVLQDPSLVSNLQLHTHTTLSPPLPSTGCALQPPVGERRDPLLESETRKYATMFQTLLMQVGDNP